MDTPFVIEQVYAAPVMKVWQALTSEDGMREWYFPQMEKFEPVVGFDFVFADDGSTHQKAWRVTKLVAGRLLVRSWIYKGYPGSSVVTFELFEEGETTMLKLSHAGLASFPDDPHFARQRFEDGWKNILGSNLKNYLSKNSD